MWGGGGSKSEGASSWAKVKKLETKNGQFTKHFENDRSWAEVKITLKKLKIQLTLEVHISEFGDGMMIKL